MKVLWYTPDKPDDISIGRSRIADHLRSRGIEVDLRGTTPRTVLNGIRTAGDYDAVVGTTRAGAVAATAIGIVRGRPLIVDHVDPIAQFEATHPDWLAVVVRNLEHATFRLADYVLYVYPEEVDRVEDRASVATRTDLGLEFETFADPPLSVVERARDTLDEAGVDGKVAIYVGGLEPIYRVETMLTCLDHLDGWTLVVLGTGTLEQEVRSAARRRDDVVFLGTVAHEEVPGYLHCADVGLCLVDDARTLKALEYGAAGLPTVQIDGAARERFEGFVKFCRADPADVARAVERAGQEVDVEGFRERVERFDWSKIADDYEHAFRGVVDVW